MTTQIQLKNNKILKNILREIKGNNKIFANKSQKTLYATFNTIIVENRDVL